MSSTEPRPQCELSFQAFGTLAYATQYTLALETLLNIIRNALV